MIPEKIKTVQEIKTSEFGRLSSILDAELASKLTLLENNSENNRFLCSNDRNSRLLAPILQNLFYIYFFSESFCKIYQIYLLSTLC